MKPFPIVVGVATAGLAAGLWHFSAPEKRAERALRRDDLPAAVDALSNALDKKNPPAREEFLRTRLIETFLSREKYDLAEAQLLQLRHDFPRNAWAAMTLGMIYADQGKPRFAREELEAAEKIEPQEARTVLALARLDYFDWEPERARVRLDAVLARHPRQREARELLSYIQFDSGNYSDAYNQLEAVWLSGPPNKRVRSLLIQCAQNMGEWDKAEKLIAEIQESDDAKRETALFALNRGEWDKAESLLDGLHSQNPWDFTIARHLAAVLAARGQMDRARQIWKELGERVSAMESESPEVAWSSESPFDRSLFRLWLRRLRNEHALLGAALAFRARNLEEADGWTRKALAISPRDYGALANMAELARLQGDNKERLRWCDKAVALYKAHPMALVNRAAAYMDLGKVDEAVADARQAAETYPGLAYAQGILAEAYLRLGKIQEGLSVAAQSAALNPFDVRCRVVLGMAQTLDGKMDAAEDNFRQALRLDPAAARAHWELGRFLQARGKIQEGQKHTQRARRLEPMVYAQRRRR